MSSILSGRLDEIDAQVEKIHRLIEGGAKIDPELAAGLATTEPMPGVQRKIDQMSAAVEELDRQFKKAAADS
jgi:hypothetical protein